jgi:hypothetical protein
LERTARMKINRILLVAALAPIAPLLAHHSFASEFDVNKPITIQGTITKVEWINPHCYLDLEEKTKDGQIQHWKFEFGAPVALRKAGMKREMLPVGQAVTLSGYDSKDGSKLGWIKKFTFPDGRQIQITIDNEDAPNPK